MYGSLAFEKLKKMRFHTVLDIGSGGGEHSELFRKLGKKVTSIDIRTTDQDYMTTTVEKHDCAWCCHVLEHQTNIGLFLQKISNDVVDDGIICITVPPAKDQIVGGHLSIWNAGLLIYNLVMAGIDCSDAMVKTYGYNVSVIVKNKRFHLPYMYSETNELTTLKPFLPDCVGLLRSGKVKSFNW